MQVDTAFRRLLLLFYNVYLVEDSVFFRYSRCAAVKNPMAVVQRSAPSGSVRERHIVRQGERV